MTENTNASDAPNIIKGCILAAQIMVDQATEILSNAEDEEYAPDDMISSLTSLAKRIEQATDLNMDGYTELNNDITVDGLYRKCQQLNALLSGFYS